MSEPGLAEAAAVAFVPSTVFNVLMASAIFWWLQRNQRIFDEKLRRHGLDPDVGYIGAAAEIQRRQRRRRGPLGWSLAWYVRWTRSRNTRLARGERLQFRQTVLFLACAVVLVSEVFLIAPVFVLVQVARH